MTEYNTNRIGRWVNSIMSDPELIFESERSPIEMLEFMFPGLDQRGLEKIALTTACYYYSHYKFVPPIWQGEEYRATGNISLRVDKGILIKPSGSAFRFMSIHDPILVDYEGKVLDGESKPSIETKMHLLIYEHRPDINAIIHVHPPALVYYDKAIKGPLTVPDDPEASFVGEVPVVPYFTPGSEELAKAVSEVAKAFKAMILRDHGFVACGETLEEAVNIVEEVENEAKIVVELHLRQKGTLTFEEVKVLRQMNEPRVA